MLACEESKAEIVAQLKKEGRFKGTELLDVMVLKAPSSRTQCRTLFGSVSQGFKEGANGLTACYLPWVQGQRKVKRVYRDFAAPENSHNPRRYQGRAQPAHWSKVAQGCAGHAHGLRAT